jgi:hypothetical protein
MTQFAYCSAEEAAIARKLVNAALAKGWLVTVYDGEEIAVSGSADRDAIFDAMNSTECDILRFRSPNDEPEFMGWVALIWGNGEDLISDYSDNKAITALVESVNP